MSGSNGQSKKFFYSVEDFGGKEKYTSIETNVKIFEVEKFRKYSRSTKGFTNCTIF